MYTKQTNIRANKHDISIIVPTLSKWDTGGLFFFLSKSKSLDRLGEKTIEKGFNVKFNNFGNSFV
jgi:hypothetical protein